MASDLEIQENDYLVQVLVGGIFGYIAYYLIFVVKKPVLAARQEYKEYLEKNCPVLTEKYKPTIWCFESRAQTIIRALIKSYPEVGYGRELLKMPDGGVVGLDWTEPENSPFPENKRPTVIILPGLTGSSDESYCRHYALQAKKMGARAVVFNNRGNGGTPLLTERTYNATNTEDLAFVIAHVKQKYPDCPLTAVGISLGALILTIYLTKSGRESDLVGAMAVSSPYDVFESAKSLEAPIDHLLFNKMLTENLIEGVTRNIHVFKKDQINLGNIKKSRSIREFDDSFTARQFGYPTYKEYYEDACTYEKLGSIRIPFLSLNASDDPFSPAHAIPVERVKHSSHSCIVVTSHGGHIGFLEGLYPRNESFMDRVFYQFMNMVFNNYEELQKILSS